MKIGTHLSFLIKRLTFKVNRKFSLFTTSYYFKCNINTSINTLYFSIPSFPNKESVFSGINKGKALYYLFLSNLCLANFYEEIKLNPEYQQYDMVNFMLIYKNLINNLKKKI